MKGCNILLAGKAKSNDDDEEERIKVWYILIKVYLKEGISKCLAL